MTISNLDLEADLIKIDFQNMYAKWGSHQPPRTGLHASSLLVKDEEWCPRRHVLAGLFPDEAVQPEAQPWDWRKFAIFENGWDLHRRWQRVFEKCGKVVWSFGQGAELDLTHFDEERNLFFSPDAILEFGGHTYVVEIKGVKQESFLELTDDLQTAMDCSEVVHKAVHQANLYMHLLDLDRAIILVENKNTQEFKLWVIQYSVELARLYTTRMYQVKGHVKVARAKGCVRVPRVCQSASDPLARQCPMRAVCFREEKDHE